MEGIFEVIAPIKPEFEKVYIDYYMLTYKYICKRINNRDVAEDLTSDVFYKAFKNYESYNPEKASVKTWLFRVIENHLKNYYRDTKYTTDIDDSINDPALMEKGVMEDAADLQECRNVIAEALKTLKERNRRAVVLRFFYDKSAEEIARELNTTAGNVRIILMRSLKKLTEYFESCGYNMEDYI